MRFFIVVAIFLFFVAMFNMIHVVIDLLLLPKVYICSEVTKADPINVQKRCKK